MNQESKIEFLKACEIGDFNFVKNFLEQNGIPDTSELDAGWTPLMRAAGWGGNAKLVSLLINFGAELEIEEPESGYTALTCAADEGNIQAIETLINAGCNIDHQDFDGQTALMSAVILNRLESVQTLARLGANLNVIDNTNRTAKEIAIGMEYDSIINFFKLMQQGK